MTKECKVFVTQWGLILTTYSPHYPRGHGFIEMQVQIIKKLFNRCKEGGSSHQMALSELWSTLLDSKTPSPGKLLYNRQYSQSSSSLSTTMKQLEHPLPARQDYSRHNIYAKRSQTFSSPASLGTGHWWW